MKKVKVGDKIKVIKEYSGYPDTLGKVFTVERVSWGGGVDTVEKTPGGIVNYIICGDEYEIISRNGQLEFAFMTEAGPQKQ